MKKQTGIWKTREGVSLRVCDMTDSHLLFSIRLVERALLAHQNRLIAQAYSFAGMLKGEMAQDLAYQGITGMEEQDPEDYLDEAQDSVPSYRWLIKECLRRKLTKLPL